MKNLILLILFLQLTAQDIKIVASTSNIAAIAKAIGKNHVKVDVIVKAQQNPHSIQVLPSYMMKISRADIYLKVGLSLDYWADQIIDGSRNSDLIIVDCSENVESIDKPVGKVDPSKGHLHPMGNPHYMLNPRQAKVAAENIMHALIKKDPHSIEDFQSNYNSLIQELDGLSAKYEKYFESAVVISYHSTFNYLIKFTGIKVAGTIEPLPGIPPTPSHLNNLIKLIPKEKATLIIQEDFFEKKSSQFLENNTGIKTVVLSPFVKDITENSYVTYYHELMEKIKGKL